MYTASSPLVKSALIRREKLCIRPVIPFNSSTTTTTTAAAAAAADAAAAAADDAAAAATTTTAATTTATTTAYGQYCWHATCSFHFNMCMFVGITTSI